MAEFHPITEIARSIQHFLIPQKKREQEKLNHSLASACTQYISDLIQYDEDEPFIDKAMKEVGARLTCLIAMPFFASLSVLQLGGTFVCHSSLTILNWDWSEDNLNLLYEDFVQTCLMVVDVFAQIFIVAPISFFDPSVYKIKPHTPLINPNDQKIIRLEQEVQGLKKERLPIISPKNPNPSLPLGITPKTYDYRSDEGELNFSTWTIPQQDTFDGLKAIETPKQFHQISSIDKFLCPQGTLELKIDFQVQINSETILVTLDKPHRVDRLVLLAPNNIDFLKDLSEGSTLSKIHTLVIRDCHTLTKETLETIARKFPNIACFGLGTCTVDEEIGGLAENHIVLRPNVSGKVGFAEEDRRGNVQELFDDLNIKLFEIVKGYEPFSGLTSKFPDSNESKLFHPAAPFITNVTFLRNTPIRDQDLIPILPRLSHCFRNMEILNLSHCKLLTVDTVLELHKCRVKAKVKKLYLASWSKLIRYKRVSEQNRKTITVDERHYLDFRYAFIIAIAQLYTSGVDQIRLDDVPEMTDLIESGINATILEQNALHLEKTTEIIYYNGEKNVPFPRRED